jgi:hypothetical protein
MKVGNLESKKGQKVSGVITAGYTTAQMPIDIPINIIEGEKDGPVLAVSGAVHGAEVIGTLGILKVLRELDPKKLRGTLIAVPVGNQSAFEFGDRVTKWDGGNLNRMGRGKEDGTLTQRIAYFYYHEVVAKSDALIDIHSGNSESYVWYTIYESEVDGADPEVIEKSKQMAIAFGLKDIMAKSPWKGTFIEDAMRDGVPAITPEIGGGLDFFHGGKKQIDDCARGITNVMKLMGMLDGDIVTESDEVTIWAGETEIINDAVGGIMLVERDYGDYLKKGDVYARMYNPFTGDEIKTIVAPADGYVIPSGARWPVVRPGRWLAILGSKLGEEKASFNQK